MPAAWVGIALTGLPNAEERKVKSKERQATGIEPVTPTMSRPPLHRNGSNPANSRHYKRERVDDGSRTQENVVPPTPTPKHGVRVERPVGVGLLGDGAVGAVGAGELAGEIAVGVVAEAWVGDAVGRTADRLDVRGDQGPRD